MPGTTQFPAALDTFPEIGPNTQENAPGVEHDVLHANKMAAIAALQAKVGVDASAVPTSLDARMAAVESGKVNAAGAVAAMAALNTFRMAPPSGAVDYGIDAVAGSAADYTWLRGGSKRWQVRLTTSDSLDIRAFSDAGVATLAARWNRTTFALDFAATPTVLAVPLATTDDLASYILATEKGAANGVAPLKSDGTIDTVYLPTAVLGQVEYKGTWDATSGAPTATPEKGWYYVVTVAGSTSLSGITDWKIGDWAIYNGSAWNKVDNTDAISSWNGRTGAVAPESGDYTFAQIGSKPTTLAGYGITDGYTDTNARAAVIASSITNGDTTHSPSGDAVFDALALKGGLADSQTWTGGNTFLDADLTVQRVNDTATNGAAMNLRRARTSTAVQSGDIIGRTLFWGHDGTAYQPSGAIVCTAAETWVSGSAQGTEYRFETTATGSTTRTSRWLFRAAGHLEAAADNINNFGSASKRAANGYITNLRPGAGAVIWTSGSGTPEGSIVAPIGSLYTRTDGGAGTTLYVKESGAGNTGWVAK